MAFSHNPKIITDGLVLALDPADKNSHLSGSGTWTDLSPLGHDGTISGSAESARKAWIISNLGTGK